MIIILSGVSGVGKNTIIKELMLKRDNLHFILSGTTRPKRENADGIEFYEYMSSEEFIQKEKQGYFFETQEVHGFMYGIIKKYIDEAIKKPENDYIRDIDVYGTQRVKAYMKGKGECVSIFLDAPNEVLRDRLKNRGETDDRIEVRLSRTKLERENKKFYDYSIENIDIQTSLNAINKILDKR